MGLMGFMGLMGNMATAQSNGTWTVYDTRNSDICGNNISALAADNKGVWAGTYQGLCRLGGAAWMDYSMFNDKLKDQSVNCLMVDARGVLWIGTDDYGVIEWDGTNWTEHTDVTRRLKMKFVKEIVIDQDGVTWIGVTLGGLVTYDGSNWTWAFAEHEWDYIGNAPGNASLTVSEPFISENGTVDLFGWVGKSSTWTGVNMFGITSSAYESLTITDGYGNVVGEAMKAEWNSTNLGSITRGGTYAWRTLTADEWYYVLATRKVTVNGESKASYGHGNVNGVNGVILLPDGWDGSVDGGFTYGSTDDENGYTNNTYSTTSTPTWSQMEAAGCAFLPAAGERYGASVNLVGADGGYWSSTAYPSFVDWACRVFFMSGSLDAGHTNFRNIAQAVRLVRPAE